MQQKDNQLKGMVDQVREAEDTVKRERKKAEERVATVEREFNEKERNLMDKIKREMNNLI